MNRRRRDYRSPEAAEYRKLYRSKRWTTLRKEHFSKPENRYCVRCLSRGILTWAKILHHKKPHRGNLVLFFDPKNVESSCKPCHDGPAQQDEAAGFSRDIGSDGWPADDNHPFNRGARGT